MSNFCIMKLSEIFVYNFLLTLVNKIFVYSTSCILDKNFQVHRWIELFLL